MLKLTINNREVKFRKGQTIIEAAREAGIEIPHFCWHPGLSVAGNCRICLVEVEKMPKLVIACSTLAEENMVVHTKSDKVIDAQNAVMEFLLINHPLDCPICDEAGECKLQDYAYKYGVGISRFDEEKTIKDKRKDIGPNVMLDQERCISCSRCIRFCEEIVKAPELTFVNRGEKVAIDTFPEKQLENPYSMNVIEICPVGALTSKHFRFLSRVWDMSFTNSICPGCSRGCNTIIGVRNQEILRIEPRENLKVNDYWLCDWGRLNTYKYVNDENLRIDSPMHKLKDESGKISGLQNLNWQEVFIEIAEDIIGKGEEILFIASPFSTLEDNYTLKKFAKEVLNTENIFYIPYIDETFGDNILKKSDKTPNSNGLKLLGIRPYEEKDIADLKSGKYKIIYVINDDISRIPEFQKFKDNIKLLIQHLSVKNNTTEISDYILPQSIYAEINGTFVNFENRIQRIRPAVATLEQERLIGEFSLSRLDKFGAHNDRWTKGKKFNAHPTWKILKQIAREMGNDFLFDNSEEVFIELCKTIPGLDGYDYDTVGLQGIIAGEKISVKTER